MRYEWSSDLETGYRSIDEQHKQLFETLNDLLWTCQHGGHHDEVKKTMDFLVNYTVKHFADEEEIQIRHNFPEYERHKRLHEDFKLTVSELAERLMQEGASVGLIAEMNSTIGDWLISHIKGEDRKVALHAKGQS